MDNELKRQRAEMQEINKRQKAFYDKIRTERRFDHSSRNISSNLWSKVRNRLWDFQSAVNMRNIAVALHKEYLYDISQKRVLDLGCATGSALTMWLAENAEEYVGIDLAEIAVLELNAKFRERGLTTAQAIVADFIDSSLPDQHFDVIYAASVLHHFRDIDVLVDELLRVLKPGGVVLSYDPLETEPLNRMVRAVYRRKQDDRDWEWPFTRDRLKRLVNPFDILAMQGLLGMSKVGFPFYFLPGMRQLGCKLAQWGISFDSRNARSLGPALYRCWHVALVLQKPTTR